VILFFADSVAPQLRPGFYSYLMSYYLMQLLMRQFRRTSKEGWGGGPRLHNPPAFQQIDRDYLAVLTLSFIVLHEIAHHPLRHTEIGFQGWPHEIAFSEALTEAVVEAHGPEAVLGTPGAVGPFEQRRIRSHWRLHLTACGSRC
jgi:hypothetical protein